MSKIKPEQVMTRCITLCEYYASYKAFFKNPDARVVAVKSNLISSSELVSRISMSLSDQVIILWCSMFGTNSEDAHWKKVIPEPKHDLFQSELHKVCSGHAVEFDKNHGLLKTFRNKYLAHGSNQVKWTLPHLDFCFRTANVLYTWIVENYDLELDASYPENLREPFDKVKGNTKAEIIKGIQFDYSVASTATFE